MEALLTRVSVVMVRMRRHMLCLIITIAAASRNKSGR